MSEKYRFRLRVVGEIIFFKYFLWKDMTPLDTITILIVFYLFPFKI